MQPSRNTLSENIRAQSIELMNKHLAAAIDLQTPVKQAQWSVREPGFIAVHDLFDMVSVEVENYSDLIAERAGGLDGTAHGTIQVAMERSFLVPNPLGIDDEPQYVFAVSGKVPAFGQSGREAAGQATTFGYTATGNPVHRNLRRRRPAALVRRLSHCSQMDNAPALKRQLRARLTAPKPFK